MEGTMIGYTMVGTNDLDVSGKFYDSILAPLGAKRTMIEESFILWSVSETNEKGNFSVTLPHDGNKATVGNGTMNAFRASSPEMVDEIYKIAMANGGSDEGEPGYRGDPASGFYAGFFRDPEGNKLNAFCIAPKTA